MVLLLLRAAPRLMPPVPPCPLPPQVYSLYTNMVLVKQKPPKHGTSGVQLLELSAATAMSRMEEGIPCSALCIEYCDMVGGGLCGCGLDDVAGGDGWACVRTAAPVRMAGG